MAECRSRSRDRYPTTTRRYTKKYNNNSGVCGGGGSGHHNYYYLSNQTSNNYVYHHYHHSVHSHHHNHNHSHHHYHHHIHRGDRDRDRTRDRTRDRERERDSRQRERERERRHRQLSSRKKEREQREKKKTKEKEKEREREYSSANDDDDDDDDNETMTDDLEGTVDLNRVHSIYKHRYAIGKKLGQGTFGSVVECIDNKRKIRVAVKIVRSVKRYLDAAEIEVDILNKLDRLDVARNSLIIRLYKSFRCLINGVEHSCLVFERCGLSLYDYIKKNKYRGFPLWIVGAVAYQLLHSIAFCHAHKLTHTDLKLENVLFVADECVYDEQLALYLPRQTLEMRLIDFGGATFDSDHHSSIINTRQYRGPEVILNLDWGAPSDIWSIGCILAELYCGELLFATHSDGEHLQLMRKILNFEQFPSHMINQSNAHLLKDRQSTAALHDDDDDDNDDGGSASSSRKYVERCRTLPQLIEDKAFCALINECLQIDPRKRITAYQAKKHPFFQHFIANRHTKKEYAHFNAIYNLIHR